uniref:Uncharacterized protein n=1 Tax=Rhizophora mucronata TaxID=61149 RepID=A0A2P2N3K5_RHIMU
MNCFCLVREKLHKNKLLNAPTVCFSFSVILIKIKSLKNDDDVLITCPYFPFFFLFFLFLLYLLKPNVASACSVMNYGTWVGFEHEFNYSRVWRTFS